MTAITRATYSFSDFRTTGGEILPEVTLAYVSRGTLAPDGRNAILVTHGYTSGPRMIEPGVASSEGAWSTLAGPGAPIDPRTGNPYGSKFPRISVEDIVTAQKRMLDGLGVKHLRAVVGPSYGGFQAFQWGVTFPDFMDGIVPVVTSPRTAGADRVGGLLKWFAPDPNWNGGDYYTTGNVKQTLTAQRVDTLRRYGMADSLAARFPTKDEAEAELHRIASTWADGFDANSLFILGRALETFDVSARFGRIKVPVLYVLSRTDALFPPSIAPGVMAGLKQADVDAAYFEIDSDHGHLASGADADKWAPALRAFMTKLETA
ncbi:MAG: alpha/beta fold hydrolase [Acetobacteraceae bacterium]|nr:alpha/beta fold hydrolase [Acetobacteraceae bacterium]